MKKVYVITFQKALNYGAALQAYALAKFLRSSNFEVEIIDYMPTYFMLQTYRPAKGIKKSIEKFKKILAFSSFSSKHLPLTKNRYFSSKSISRISDGDAFICGSDQIWNYRLTGGKFDKAFFLDFVPAESRRIAYAASAGSIRVHDHTSEVKELTSKFYAIGAREETLASDLENIIDKNRLAVVVDPSLLIKDYIDVYDQQRIPATKYILSYVVGSGEMLARYEQAVAELKKSTNIPVIHIGAKHINSADINILDVSPGEWVSFIKNADFVITNSFHGTAFSINLEKQFIFIPHILKNLNARQTTLLNRVGLMSRCANDTNDIRYDKHAIDYSEVSPKLESVVLASKQFLLESLR
ncbi:UNVERIFIED_ORG: adenosine/AMP kinase [Pseudomonas reinekei]|uniref:polysaccharide pyruvyl transferase family protein n=1 Tax=Pseudomonas laurylsulfatiphila TaxID=2011015 RepID=UPI003D1E3D4C|nr:adenosine/AMP kinase [Pseudomonas reinekei]